MIERCFGFSFTSFTRCTSFLFSHKVPRYLSERHKNYNQNSFTAHWVLFQRRFFENHVGRLSKQWLAQLLSYLIWVRPSRKSSTNSSSMGASFYRLLSSEFDLGAIFGNAIGATFNTAFGRDCKGRPQGDYFFGCQVQNWVIWSNFIWVVKVCWPVQHRKKEEVSPGHAVLHKQQPGSSNSSFLKTLQLFFPLFFRLEMF